MQRSALCRSRRELSNEYLLAKFGFDTAENEPRKVCPLSVYRILLLLQIPKVGEMYIAGPLHLGVPKSTPGSPSFEATHLVCTIGAACSVQISHVGAMMGRLTPPRMALLERGECKDDGQHQTDDRVLVERFDIEPFPDFSAK